MLEGCIGAVEKQLVKDIQAAYDEMETEATLLFREQRAAYVKDLATQIRHATGGGVTVYIREVFVEIEVIVKNAQRHLRRGVLPKHIQSRMNFPRHEGSIRRDMATMSDVGRLIRIGGGGSRQGYRLPTSMERLAWRLNGGMFPHGADGMGLFVRAG